MRIFAAQLLPTASRIFVSARFPVTFASQKQGTRCPLVLAEKLSELLKPFGCFQRFAAFQVGFGDFQQCLPFLLRRQVSLQRFAEVTYRLAKPLLFVKQFSQLVVPCVAKRLFGCCCKPMRYQCSASAVLPMRA